MGSSGNAFARLQFGSVSAKWLSSTSASALMLGGSLLSVPAFAQTAAAPAQSAQAQPKVEEIVVTATRIIRDGYEAPTPTTVIGAEQIQAAAQNNIADYVTQLPSLAGSTTTRNSGSANFGGIASMNLRGLGTNRTLVLLDGHRIVNSVVTGAADVSELPQALVSRVDVVTGGASAAWGSDAVSGVVNFVLDKKFTGIKGDISGGVTTYGDDRQGKITLTGGTGFAGDRGHFLISGEYSNGQGVLGANVARPWYQGWKLVSYALASTPAGSPQLLVLPHVGVSASTAGSIVTAGPLQGLEFGPGGTPSQFKYGTFFVSPFTQGSGESQINDIGGAYSLDDKLIRETLYTRISYDLTDNINAWVEGNYGYVNNSFNCCYTFENSALTIQRDNPFLPAQVAQQMTTLGLTSFTAGSWNQDLGQITFDLKRTMKRFAAGLDGTFGDGWSWHAYYQYGFNPTTTKFLNTLVTAKYMRAIDAVRAPNGSIVCRSTLTDPTNGCVPLNVLGTGVASQAAINYVEGVPQLNQTLTESVGAASIQGEPLSDWAGPISVAAGAEYRKESTYGVNDPLSTANSYFAGNFHGTVGSYNVVEGFAETVIPLAKDTPWAYSADINAAVRETHYSTSGSVTTWKIGMTYAPIADLRLRATRSRDIRAPNVSDLFAAGQTNTQTVVDDFAPNAGKTYTILRHAIGNTVLSPEKADTSGIGAVYQPGWFHGFSASIDWYDIGLKNAIATLNNQQIMDQCFQGTTLLCQYITRNSAGILTDITAVPVNIASQTTRGYDIEASYRTPLDAIVTDMEGNLTIRLLATHVITNKTNALGVITQIAGVNGGSVPSWHWLGTVTYDAGPFTTNIGVRAISAGVLNWAYVECASGCPASTITHPTINNNHVDGALYVDIGGSYKIAQGDNGSLTEVYLKVDNVANSAPPVAVSGLSNGFLGLGTNTTLYDTLGRMFHLGVRFKM